jgi:protein-L-isoaspartate O-methyltransferase
MHALYSKRVNLVDKSDRSHFYHGLLGLDEGHKFLEVGLGSGYGTALAREIVGENGLVVSIEIDPLTLIMRKKISNLQGITISCSKKEMEASAIRSFLLMTESASLPPAPGFLIAPVIEQGIQLSYVARKTRERFYSRDPMRGALCFVKREIRAKQEVLSLVVPFRGSSVQCFIFAALRQAVIRFCLRRFRDWSL